MVERPFHEVSLCWDRPGLRIENLGRNNALIGSNPCDIGLSRMRAIHHLVESLLEGSAVEPWKQIVWVDLESEFSPRFWENFEEGRPSVGHDTFQPEEVK